MPGRAETGAETERASRALRVTIAELKAGQTLMVEMHARELALARHDAEAAQQAAAELRLGEKQPGRRAGAGHASERRVATRRQRRQPAHRASNARRGKRANAAAPEGPPR